MFDNGFLAAFGAGPVADLGEVLDARVGEGGADGEVRFRVGLRSRRIPELREREQGTTRDGEEDDVIVAALANEDALTPVATVAAGVVDVVHLVDAELVDRALAHNPAGRSVRLAIVAQHERLRGTRAEDVGRHRGGAHLFGGLHAVEVAAGHIAAVLRIPVIARIGFFGPAGEDVQDEELLLVDRAARIGPRVLVLAGKP